MAASSVPDPREILGVGPSADADEIAAAYRREAKRWHPDRGRDERSGERMALVNAAYDELRATAPAAASTAVAPRPPAPAEAAGPLATAARRALGGELGALLEAGERVELVTATATWASPQTYLAVTDRRIMWLLDDAPVHRVRSLPRRDVRRVSSRPARFWRGASVTIEDRRGRRFSFGELPAPTAEALVRRVGATPRPTPGDAAG